jgi:hypothetical protein
MENSAAIEMIEKNQNKIKWLRLCENPAIFEL